nr:hypothetical protein [Providencia stuartii]
NQQLKNIFDYNAFVRKSKKWNAYSLCKTSKTRTCPYCNQAYAFTIQKNDRGFRPTLDHFYCKDKYPHLALALNNLVPSCNTCNSSLKGQINFYITEHLNPLWDNENLSFSLSASENIASLESQIKNRSDKLKITITLDNPNCNLSRNSIETFMLEERYEFMIDEAIDFLIAKMNYEEACNNIEYFRGISEATFIRFDKENYKNHLLGKLYLGLYNQYSES